MPAARIKTDSKTTKAIMPLNKSPKTNQKHASNISENIVVHDFALQSKDHIYYPVTETERNLYRTFAGKKITPHQWTVYDLTRQIPCGKVTTYKHLCVKLGRGSPRSVGSALRQNPFAPYIPCHRVIASDFTLGGFQGEWGTQDKQGSNCSRKFEMLEMEGVAFHKSGSGRLVDEQKVLWE